MRYFDDLGLAAARSVALNQTPRVDVSVLSPSRSHYVSRITGDAHSARCDHVGVYVAVNCVAGQQAGEEAFVS